nr:YbjN domain-containing protein [Corynebacterium sp. c6VSa_13]
MDTPIPTHPRRTPPTVPTDPHPVTIERIAGIIADSELLDAAAAPDSSTDTASSIKLSFPDGEVVFALQGASLICDALWAGRIPSEQAATVLAVVNEWNLTNVRPTLRFFELEDAVLRCAASRRNALPDALNDEQLRHVVLGSLHAATQAFAGLAQAFPQAVTWQDDATTITIDAASVTEPTTAREDA